MKIIISVQVTALFVNPMDLRCLITVRVASTRDLVDFQTYFPKAELLILAVFYQNTYHI